MKIHFVTLFPQMYQNFLETSIIQKAIKKQLVNFELINFRKFGTGKHLQVDDTVYGGGKGMLLQVEPIAKALATIKGKKILLSPQGKPFTQTKALAWMKAQEITLIAGHYEGFDERVRLLVDEEISIGDFVLTGGELPSMMIADAVVRLVPGVIQTESHAKDSFQNNLLDYAQYTKPRDYQGMLVPDLLLNGNHAQIEKWRKAEQIQKTQQNRPDLYQKYLKGEKNAK